MKRIKEKLSAGMPVHVLVLGDSISRGSDASVPSKGFVSLFADGLHERYGSRIEVTNLSVGGATARTAGKMIRKITCENIDLGIVAVGVNDAEKKTKLSSFRSEIAKITACFDTLVVTPLLPANANVWPYHRALCESRVPVADVTARWNETMTLANGVNHPDDAGHRLYADVLLQLF